MRRASSIIFLSSVLVANIPMVLRGQETPRPARIDNKFITSPRSWRLGLPALGDATLGTALVKVALGRRLFFDPLLSGNGTVSCATCHKPEYAFGDNQASSRGAAGRNSSRKAPSLVNVAYFTSLFWDGRARSLEEQVAAPIESPDEMECSKAAIEQRLNADTSYRTEFAQAWGRGPIGFDIIAKSIASYERTILSGNSPFDRWKYGHDERAVDESVKGGYLVFTSKKRGNCAACHTIGKQYALLTDNKFHNIGVGVIDGKPTDMGRYTVTHNEADRGKFKTPSLRNLALTAPYMHDGSLKTLKQVLDFYIGGGNSNPNLDREIHTLDFLTGQERRDLLAFLNSLNGDIPTN
jgi:cytochrome c peroxidase